MLKLDVQRSFLFPPWYLVVAIVAQAFVSSPATAVLIAHWDMEEGAGSATTAAVGAPTANGVLLGGAGWDTQFLPPVVGGTSAAISLTGPPDGISTTFLAPTGGAARTIAAWIRADPAQLIPGVNLGGIVSYGNTPNAGERFAFRIDVDDGHGRLRLEVNGDWIIGNAIVADNQWHHVAVVLPDNDPDGDLIADLEDASFYVDGALDASMNAGFFDSGPNDVPISTAVASGFETFLGNSAHSISNFGLVGALDDVRIYDNALSSGDIAALAPTLAGEFLATVNRQTGEVIVGNSTTRDIDFVAYTLRSGTGALDSASGDTIADLNANWLRFSPLGETAELSEGEQPDGSGMTIATTSQVGLGSVWLQNPTEDLTLEMLSPEGTKFNVPVVFDGNPIPSGDMDFDGDVDELDWPTYRAGMFKNLSGLSAAQQYQMGDLNGDGLNNELDFLAFKEAFDANMGSGAFQAKLTGVPEPSSLFLFALPIGVMLCLRARKATTRLIAGSRLPTLCMSALFVSLCFSRGAMGVLVLHYDFESEIGGVVSDISGFGTAIDLTLNNGASIVSDASRGNVISLDGVDDYGSTAANTLGNKLDTQNSLTMMAWINTTTTSRSMIVTRTNGPGYLLELNRDGNTGLTSSHVGGPGSDITGTSIVNDGNWRHVAMTYDGTTQRLFVDGIEDAMTNASVTDFTQTHPFFVGALRVPVQSDQRTFAGLIDDVRVYNSVLSESEIGEIAFPVPFKLSLEVNTDTGVTKIINDSGASVDINFYKLTSASGSLDTANWDSLFDQNDLDFPAGDGSGNGWEEAGGSNDSELGETFLQDFSTLADQAILDLGSAFKQGTGANDVMLRYMDVSLGYFVDVEATYVTGGALGGDYNGDGVVNAADYAVWRDNLGASITLAGENPSATSPGMVDAEDYTFWKSRFGATTGSIQSASATVPEPGAVLLIGIAVATFLLSKRGPKLALLVAMAIAPTCLAATTDDRVYQFGDDGAENGMADTTVGTGAGNPIFGSTLDSMGDGTANFVDLQANGDPQYRDVDALNRPLAANGELGIEFDGNGDYLMGARLGLPSTSAISDDGIVTVNYAGIANRGFQLWARPNSVGNGTVQTVVADTEQHGIGINNLGNWEMRYAGSVVDTGEAVNFDNWSHLMLVRPFGPARGAWFYLDGEVIATVAGGYDGGNNAPLVVGANTGASPGTAEFFTGELDDLDMFVLGVATAPPIADFGTFDPAEDNDFIADALASMTPGDLTGDGMVTGNGSGLPASDDVAAFLANWNTKYLVGGIQVGDLASRDMGDFNLDGIVDLLDWSILRSEHESPGSLNLGELLAGTDVPEPSTFALMAIMLASAISVCRFRLVSELRRCLTDADGGGRHSR